MIQSVQNAKVKLLRAMRSGRERDWVLLEGARVLADALSADIKPRWVLFDPGAESSLVLETLQLARDAGVECLPCDSKLMAADGDLVSAAQILGCVARPQTDPDQLFADAAAANGLIVVSAGVQDPGNAGALVRCAAGLGAFGILFLKGGVSPWHPRAIRGASGTSFRLPVSDGLDVNQFVELCRKHAVQLWATAADGDDMDQVQRRQSVALVLGEEGGGLPKRLQMECDRSIGIPLQRDVESLNVATAAALLIHALAL